MADYSCLAENLIVPADFAQTGINLNELVIGPTGCGKTWSNAFSRLLHTNTSSVVVPLAKRALKDKFTKMFKKRGYEIMDLDFSNPRKSTVCYDPMDYVKTDEDVIQLAKNLIGVNPSRTRDGNLDPYWNDSATSILAAEIGLIRLNALYDGKQPSIADVVKLHRSIVVSNETAFSSNIDILFDHAASIYPGNQATELWKTIRGLAPKTASCILSIVNNAMDKIFGPNILELAKKKKKLAFKKLGEKRIALFITTSPMNTALLNLVNVLYADMFRELFNTAEATPEGKLKIPVHIICDDFACTGRIEDFDSYISIFRAAGISVTLLLQSETQLVSMYGENAATTIINNCDTYIYMGGMDSRTCRNVSEKINKPVSKVMSMPIEHVMVFRRGSDPIETRRYQILEDPLFKEMMEDEPSA